METIITLLIVLLPLVFKLIGKKFEQAGQSEKAERMREFAELFGKDDDDDPAGAEFEDDLPVTEVRPAASVRPAPVVTENVARQTTQKRKPVVKKPVLIEEEDRKGEKIDPKKLVIYSEIMKPKYTE